MEIKLILKINFEMQFSIFATAKIQLMFLTRAVRA